MTIETKFLIGLFILMFLGSFMASFIADDCGPSWTSIGNSYDDLTSSFENLNVKSIVTIPYQVGAFLVTLATSIGSMILWNFCFLDNYNWLRFILISINIALLVKILFDLWRAAKPFGG
jgi:hypothetical protein